jgi:UDP-4-amino-4,6-dideoxy-N-acetyl-beta-L-altrosamine N-acetyltransferase
MSLKIIEKLRINLELDGITLNNFINLPLEKLEMIRRWRNNLNVRKWMYNDSIINREEHINFIKKLKKDSENFYYLVVNEKIDIGVVYLNKVDFKNKNAYFGIYANPKNRVIGAGSLLCYSILQVVFDIINFHTLKLEVIENNFKALGLYRKFGFKKEGRLREFVFRDGKWLDVIIMGITAEEYKIGKNRK